MQEDVELLEIARSSRRSRQEPRAMRSVPRRSQAGAAMVYANHVSGSQLSTLPE
jgi:hypothetical protein